MRPLLLFGHSASIISLYVLAFFLFARASLILMLLSVSCVLVLNRILPYFQKVLVFLYCLSLLLVILPIDVRIQNRGAVEIGITPISWGLLSTEGDNKVAHGRLIRGGCMVPFHPATHAVVLTY
ncbi:hypothetical protein L0244_07285 [bacterium]|nr:hypothetical protein [bacterium]